MADVNFETQEAEDQYRAELAASLWDGEAMPDDDQPDNSEVLASEKDTQTEDKREETGDDDPLSGVDPRVLQLLQDMEAKVATMSSLEHRLKQAERRVGSLQNSLQNAQTAAQQTSTQGQEAPSKKEIEKAAATDEAWDSLKEEYPEWADVLEGMDKRFAGRKAADIPAVNIDQIRTELQTDFDKRLNQAQQEFEVKLVAVKHPQWREIVRSTEYTEWLAKQPKEFQEMANTSERAEDAITVLDRFTGQIQAKPKTTSASDRQARLNRAETATPAARSTTTKSVEDMSDQEYRAYLARNPDLI